MKHKVSIIIPCFNDADFVEESIMSAKNQTYLEKEIIVIDDGSNRETKRVLGTLENKINLLITQENEGVSVARNKGIEASTGEYILVLDSDDYFEHDFCEKAVEILKYKSKVKLVTCYARWFWNQNNYQIFKPIGGSVTNFLTKSAALGNSLFRKEEWSLAGGYDEKMLKGWEDWEFFIRLLKQGGEAYVIEEPLFNYRKKVSSRTTTANQNKFILMKYIFNKHSDLYKENFEDFVDQIINRLQIEEREKNKNKERVEYRIGNTFLKPLRKIKGIFR